MSVETPTFGNSENNETSITRESALEAYRALRQDYDEAVDEGLKEEILAKIQQIDEVLGKDAPPLLVETESTMIDYIRERMDALAEKLLQSPDDAESELELRRLLTGDRVKALTKHSIDSRGYIDEAAGRAHTFIKISDIVALYGQGDMAKFSFDRVQVLTVDAARPLVTAMEANPKLIKEHP